MNLFTITVETGELEDESTALGERCERILSAGVVRAVGTAIDAGASYARANHGYKDRTGALTASIDGKVETTTANGAAGFIEASAKHASYIEKGTRPHDIRPKAGEGTTGPLRKGQSRRTKDDIGTHRVALRWTQDGETRFAAVVHHPGTEAIPFMREAADAAALVLTDEIDQTLSEVAALIEG